MMPFKSQAQRRLFFAKYRRGEISKKTLDEWQDETRGKKLPDRVKSASFEAGVEDGLQKSAGGGDSGRSYDITHSSWPAELKKLKKGRGPKAAWSGKLKTAADKSPSVSSSDRARFKKKHGDVGCSLKRDDKGFYVATHRARSSSYPSPESIPSARVKFVESTG
jgi:hypothetical protein